VAVNRRTLTVLVVVVLGVVALGLSAATLTTPEETPGGSGQSSDRSSSPGETRSDEGGSSDLPTPDFLGSLLLVVGGLALLASLVYMAVYDRRRLAVFLGILVVIVLFGLLIQQLELQPADSNPTGTPSGGGESGESDEGSGSERGTGGGSGQAEDNTAVAVPALLLGVVFLVLLFISYLLVDRTVTEPGPAETEESEPQEPTALGEIAGQAADRIEGGGDHTTAADNEVYRAWQEMTAQLDIERGETTTPREFEARATEVGMAADDVRELRRLFEDIRYGGESPTDDRERRAVTVLRRVETRYGEGS
jgi:hypothetical protein